MIKEKFCQVTDRHGVKGMHRAKAQWWRHPVCNFFASKQDTDLEETMSSLTKFKSHFQDQLKWMISFTIILKYVEIHICSHYHVFLHSFEDFSLHSPIHPPIPSVQRQVTRPRSYAWRNNRSHSPGASGRFWHNSNRLPAWKKWFNWDPTPRQRPSLPFCWLQGSTGIMICSSNKRLTDAMTVSMIPATVSSTKTSPARIRCSKFWILKSTKKMENPFAQNKILEDKDLTSDMYQYYDHILYTNMHVYVNNICQKWKKTYYIPHTWGDRKGLTQQLDIQVGKTQGPRDCCNESSSPTQLW